MSDLISRQEVSDIIKTRLYQTALNNTECITSYAKVCEDIAENRIDTWINEAKSVESERKKGKWIRGEAYPHHIYCSECYKTFIPNDEFRVWANGDIPRKYCPSCGAKMEVDG